MIEISQIKFFENFRSRAPQIQGFKIFKNRIFLRLGSKVNLLHWCVRNIQRAPKSFWKTLLILAFPHKIFELRVTLRTLCNL